MMSAASTQKEHEAVDEFEPFGQVDSKKHFAKGMM